MSAEVQGPRWYEIRVAGALGEALVRAFTGMRATRLEPGSLLRIEEPREGWDAADITALLRERGHSVRSVRRCASFRPGDGHHE